MSEQVVTKIIDYISIFLALLLVIPVHEFAHAFAAVKSGDNTPKINGRLTLNPLAHFDLLGLCCFVLAGIGWSKPVPVNPYNYKHLRRDSFFVAISGVVANYILAFLFYPLFIVALLYIPRFYYFTDVLSQALFYVYRLSLVFFVFNLIPIYPLDGFMVVDAFNRKHGFIYRFLRNQARYVLLVLFALGVVADYTGIYQMDILGIAINFIVGWIGKPITLFWGLIF